MKNLFILIIIFNLFFIIPLVTGQLGIPHQFWGTVTFNEAPASEGLSIEARIDDITVKESSTKDGKYGFDSLFIIIDPDADREGKNVVFYVDGIEATSFIYGNGLTTELNLAASGSTNTGGTSGGGSSGSGSSGSSGSNSRSVVSPALIQQEIQSSADEKIESEETGLEGITGRAFAVNRETNFVVGLTILIVILVTGLLIYVYFRKKA